MPIVRLTEQHKISEALAESITDYAIQAFESRAHSLWCKHTFDRTRKEICEIETEKERMAAQLTMRYLAQQEGLHKQRESVFLYYEDCLRERIKKWTAPK